jgi:hypothetical protein
MVNFLVALGKNLKEAATMRKWPLSLNSEFRQFIWAPAPEDSPTETAWRHHEALTIDVYADA